MTKWLPPPQIDYIYHYILSGLPCSGKGEHSKILKEMIPSGIQTIEMGESFRQEIYSNTDLGRIIATDVWAGNLLSDTIAYQMFGRFAMGRHSIIDGFPRTPAQAEGYLNRVNYLNTYNFKIIPMVFNINLDPSIAIERMGYRLKACKEQNIPVRADDQLDILQHRIELAQTITMPALEYLRIQGIPVLELDGTQDIKYDPDARQNRINDIQNFITSYEQRCARPSL